MVRDLFKAVGSLVGTVAAIPIGILTSTLGLTADMVKEAIDAGCKTEEDIRKYWRK